MNEIFRNVVVDISDQPMVSAQVCVLPIEGRFRVQSVDESFHNWSGLAARGAYCLSNSLPENATASVSAVEASKNNEYCWTVQLTNCDNRCLILLANILSGQTFQEQASLEGMSSEKLWCKRISIGPPSATANTKRYDFRVLNRFAEDMYPDFTRIIRPKVSFEGTGTVGSFRRMSVQFQTDSAEARFEMLAELADLWSKVVQNGFPNTIEELYDGNCFIDGVTVDLFDGYTLEVKVDEFGGSESAWNPLINVLATIRNEIARIRIY